VVDRHFTLLPLHGIFVVYEVALRCGVDSGEVASEWIAFSTENDYLVLSSENIDKWDSKVLK